MATKITPNVVYSTSTNAVSSFDFSGITWVDNQVVPKIRRTRLGDGRERPDTDGYWLHVAINKDGIPKESVILEVSGNVWRYLDDMEPRIWDKLPKGGLYIYLY